MHHADQSPIVTHTKRGKELQHPGRGTAYIGYGCRCTPCRDFQAELTRKLRAKRAGQDIPEGIEHGRASTYDKWGCRCGECRDEWTKVSRARKEKRVAGRLSVQPPEHGSHSRYNNWGCRCTHCSQAAAEYRANRKAQRAFAKKNETRLDAN